MKASSLMFELQSAIKTHGDLPIIGGHLFDDTPLRHVILVDDKGCDARQEQTKPVGIFLTN